MKTYSALILCLSWKKGLKLVVLGQIHFFNLKTVWYLGYSMIYFLTLPVKSQPVNPALSLVKNEMRFYLIIGVVYTGDRILQSKLCLM